MTRCLIWQIVNQHTLPPSDLLFPLRACALSVDGFSDVFSVGFFKAPVLRGWGDLPRSAFLVDRVGLLSTLAFYPPRSSHLLRLSLQGDLEALVLDKELPIQTSPHTFTHTCSNPNSSNIHVVRWQQQAGIILERV